MIQDPPHRFSCGGIDALVDGRQLRYSGFLMARLRRQRVCPDDRDARAMGATADALDGFRLSPHGCQWLLGKSSVAEVEAFERPLAEALRPGFCRRLRLDLRHLDGVGLQSALDRVRAVEWVEDAYAEIAVAEPRVAASSREGSAGQGYLDVAPAGVGARSLWDRRVNGKGIRLVDVEMGWVEDHEDIDNRKLHRICNDINSLGVNHGTGVLGILMAKRNRMGGTGVAYGVEWVGLASHYREDTHDCGYVAEAIHAAQHYLRRGDVLLLEVQRDPGSKYLPTEIDPCDQAAIQCATAHGITVVEAAGDGGQDLAVWKDAMGRHTLDRGSRDFVDSGAVMVGAALCSRSSYLDQAGRVDRSQCSGTSDPKPYYFALPNGNYGSRVDCFSWGECILTTGKADPGNQPPKDPDTPLRESYRCDFGATSGAAAIIAGAAVLVQQAHTELRGGPLDPCKVRQLFSTIGSCQSPQEKHTPIGRMPDLEAILRLL